MNKTQQHLMAMIAAHGGVYGVDTMSGRGPGGGKTVSAGARQRDAMFALENKGLIKITNRTAWTESRNGYTVGGTSFAFSLA
jgi:hypothetical protein